MAAFCVKHGYCGRRTAAELLARLRAAPAGTAGEVAHRGAARRRARRWSAVLTALNTAVKNLDRSVAAHLGEHPDGAIFTSLPRSGQVNAAQVLAEWGDCRQAYAAPRLRRRPRRASPRSPGNPASTAPCSFRWACNKRFRVAITTFADNSRHASPWAAKIYQRRPRQRQGPPARRPHPRPRLDPRHLALLDRRHTPTIPPATAAAAQLLDHTTAA